MFLYSSQHFKCVFICTVPATYEQSHFRLGGLMNFYCFLGPNDEPFDVFANMGWQNATASYTEAQTIVDREAAFLSNHSRSCECHTYTQCSSR